MNRSTVPFLLSIMVSTAGVTACGGAASRDIVAPREVKGSSGAPSVARIVDLGDLAAIPATGALPTGASDGVFVVGELILIEGDDFGKQPTVSIGTRPASILARTGSGGIVCRIPPEVPSGPLAIEVSHPGGRGARELSVTRHIVVVDGAQGQVHLATIDAKGAIGKPLTLAVPGARAARFVATGETVLVAVDGDGGKSASLAVIAMAAKGGPRLERSLDLGLRGAVHFLSMAARGPAGVVAVGDQLVFIDTSLGRHPTLGNRVPAGEAPIAGALSPDATRLAVLYAERNAVVLAEYSPRLVSLLGSRLGLLPQARVPLVRAVTFAPDGSAAWVVAGNTEGSRLAGKHPTMVLAATGTPAAPAVESSAEVATSMAPVALIAAHRDQTLSAAAIRSLAARAPLLLATRASETLEATPDYTALLAAGTPLGQIIHTDLEGNATVLIEGPFAIGDVALSFDASVFAAPARRLRAEQGTVRSEFGLLAGPLEGGDAAFVRLADGTGGVPYAPASVALSP